MIIEEVELHNIRSYKDAKIPFQEGTILFQGDIGSGKSSILMAIDFALFGTSERDTYEKLLRKGEREAYVRVKFRSDGAHYEIYRSVEKTKRGLRSGDSYLLTPQGRRPVSPLEIKSLILSLLGVEVSNRGKKSHPIVKYAIYTPQEMMKEILSSKSEERLKVMRRIFRIDEYETARNNTKIVAGNMGREIGKLEGLADTLEEDKLRIKEMREKLEKREDELKDVWKKLESLKSVKKNKEMVLRELEERERIFRDKSEKLKILKERLKWNLEEIEKKKKDLQEMENRKRELQKVEGDARRYEKLREKLENLKKDIEELNSLEKKHAKLEEILKNKMRIKEETEKLREDMLRSKEEIEKLRSALKLNEIEEKKSELEEKINGLIVQYRKVKGDLSDLRKEREEYETMSVCPKCKRPLNEEHRKKLIQETEMEINKKEKNMRRLENKMEGLRRQLEEMKKALEEQREIDKKVSYFQSKLQLQESNLEELKKNIQDIPSVKEKLVKISERIAVLKQAKEDYDKIMKTLRELEPMRDAYIRLLGEIKKEGEIRSALEGIKKGIVDMENEIARVENEIKEINYEPEKLERARNEWEDTLKRAASLEEHLKNLEREIEELRENTEILERDISEREKKVEKLDALRQIKKWLEEDFIAALEEIEKVRMNMINEEFKMLFEEWFHELLGDTEYEATVDEYFEPIIRYQNFDMPLTTLSGGERTSVALAYRLALNTMVKRALGLKTSILILDEPTEGFSKDQLYKLKDIFEKMETNQIIIVTHEKELVNLADVVYLVEKINGESRVTIMQGA